MLDLVVLCEDCGRFWRTVGVEEDGKTVTDSKDGMCPDCGSIQLSVGREKVRGKRVRGEEAIEWL